MFIHSAYTVEKLNEITDLFFIHERPATEVLLTLAGYVLGLGNDQIEAERDTMEMARYMVKEVMTKGQVEDDVADMMDELYGNALGCARS